MQILLFTSSTYRRQQFSSNIQEILSKVWYNRNEVYSLYIRKLQTLEDTRLFTNTRKLVVNRTFTGWHNRCKLSHWVRRGRQNGGLNPTHSRRYTHPHVNSRIILACNRASPPVFSSFFFFIIIIIPHDISETVVSSRQFSPWTVGSWASRKPRDDKSSAISQEVVEGW